MNLASLNIFAILPAVILSVFGIAVMVLEPFVGEQKKSSLAWLALAGTVAAMFSLVPMAAQRGQWYSNLWIVDDYDIFLSFVFLLVAAITILTSVDYLGRERMNHPEFYALLLFATAGMVMMAASNELVMIFLGLEILSIATYVMAGFRRTDLKSNESSLKYFLLGSFSSAFFLYGIALIFGATGSTNLIAIAGSLRSPNIQLSLVELSAALMLIALCFKVAVAPFHIWTPDVYEGAPTPVTALFSAGPKAATFALMLRIFATVSAATSYWFWAFWILAALTMFAGNLGALVQNNVKRLLAYSSIAHAGYVLVALAAVTGMKPDPDTGAVPAYAAVLFYLATYAFVSVGAFTVLSELGGRGERHLTSEDFAGLGTRQPFAAAMMALFLLSFLGLPITAGFFGKLYIFKVAVKSHLLWLAILMAVNSVIGSYYYLKIIIVMYMREYKGAEPADSGGLSATAAMVVSVAALITLYLGLAPNHILGIVLSQNLILSSR